MSLRDFLDAAYTILVREVLRQGHDLNEALEKLMPFASRTVDDPDAAARAAEAARYRQEERDMRRLEGALARAGMGSIR